MTGLRCRDKHYPTTRNPLQTRIHTHLESPGPPNKALKPTILLSRGLLNGLCVGSRKCTTLLVRVKGHLVSKPRAKPTPWSPQGTLRNRAFKLGAPGRR